MEDVSCKTFKVSQVWGLLTRKGIDEVHNYINEVFEISQSLLLIP